MRATLYEVLGIPPSAGSDEIKAALRRLVRRYYMSTQEGQADAEEALRFVNHASRILNDPELRRQYDQELAGGVHTSGELPRNYFVTNLATVTRKTAGDMSTLTASGFVSGFLGGDPRAAANQFALVESLSRFGRTVLGQTVFGGMVGVLLVIATWVLVPQLGNILERLRLLAIALLVILAAGGLIYGLIRLISAWRDRKEEAIQPQLDPVMVDTVIPRWRRERTVFLGNAEPMEDSAWVFKLRMAELARQQSGRSSKERPWQRLFARLFDYGLWGLILAGMVFGLEYWGVLRFELAAFVEHPFVAPVLIATTWVPVEVLLFTFFRATPGKWLFGIFVQFAVSDPFASYSTKARLKRAWLRATRVWWRGVGTGLPFVSLVTMSVARATLEKRQETSWDFDGDCLVTHTPMAWVNAVTATFALLAIVWFYGTAWQLPMEEAWVTANRYAAEAPDQVSKWRTLLPSLIPGLRLDSERRTETASSATPADTATPGRMAAVAPVRPEGLSTDGAPSPLELKRQRWLAYQRDAQRLRAAGDWNGLRSVCLQWSDQDFRNPRAWECLGQAYFNLGQYREAISAYKQASRLAPEDRQIEEQIVRAFRAQFGG